MKKTIVMLLITIAFIVLLIQPSKAETDSDGIKFSWGIISGKVQAFMSDGDAKEIEAGGLINGMANILTTVGVVVVLAGIIIVGIMYMTASPEQAAKLKMKLVGLALAGIIIIGAFGIWSLTRIALENVTRTIVSEESAEEETTGEQTPLEQVSGEQTPNIQIPSP